MLSLSKYIYTYHLWIYAPIRSHIDLERWREKKGEKKTDNKIQIPGFGIFEMKKRKAREARNPRTGAKVKVPAKQVVKFKPSETLKNKIN